MILKEWAFTIALIIIGLVAVFGLSYPNVSKTVETIKEVGAVSVLTSPQEWNGVAHINERQAFKSGTSTVVSIKLNATTSPMALTCKSNGGLSFAQQFDIAYDPANNTGTTTRLGLMNVTANGLESVVATTSGISLSPGFINVKMATGSAITVSTALAPKGFCTLTGTITQ